MRAFSSVSVLESKITFIEHMLKGLSIQQLQPSHISLLSCFHCETLEHPLSFRPCFARQEQDKKAY